MNFVKKYIDNNPSKAHEIKMFFDNGEQRGRAFVFFKKKKITYLIVKEMKWKILCIFVAEKVKNNRYRNR